MANIFINFYKAKVGGGSNICINFVNEVFNSPGIHRWYILIPNNINFPYSSNAKVKLIKISDFWDYNLMLPFLYFFKIKSLCNNYRIDSIVNFGDIIIPNVRNQIYFFDWAYAVYNEKYIWCSMSLKDKLIRKLKVALIKIEIGKVSVIIAQTNNMVIRLKESYGIKNVCIIPTPFGINTHYDSNSTVVFDLPINRMLFLVPASFSSHKNFSIILQVAELIDQRELPYTIVLTIDRNKSTESYFKKIELKGLLSIISVGKQEYMNMPSLYKQCDVMFLPTLLESYGLPYVEAMAYGLPIITSDLDFAHDVCENIALYFNPFDANSILEKMQEVQKKTKDLDARIKQGREKVHESPNWNDVFKSFVNRINEVINI